MSYRKIFFLISLAFFSCDPTKMIGKEDPQVLSVILESEQDIYEYGEPLRIRANVASQLSTVRLYEWYTDGRFEPALVNDIYNLTPTRIADEPYAVTVSVKVRVGFYVASSTLTVTVNPPIAPDVEFYVNGAVAQTQLLLYGEKLEATVQLRDGKEPKTCFFYWDSKQLNEISQTKIALNMTEREFGTHRFSVKVSDGTLQTEKTCTVKVGPVLGGVRTEDHGFIHASFGEDLEIDALFRAADNRYQLVSASWSIGALHASPAALTPLPPAYHSDNGLKLYLPGSSDWMRPADSVNGKQYQLRIEFRFTDSAQTSVQTIADSVILELDPYEPLKIERLTVPRSVSFFEYRNGLVPVSVAVTGGRMPLNYEWSVNGDSTQSVSVSDWKLPIPPEPAENPGQCLIRILVDDGITQETAVAEMTVLASDAPRVMRFYSGEQVNFDPESVASEEVFFIISRAEKTGAESRSVSMMPTEESAVSASNRGVDVLETEKSFLVSGRTVTASLCRTVEAEGVVLEIWIDNKYQLGLSNSPITETDLTEIIQTFLPTNGKGIYHWAVNALGAPWGQLPSVLYTKYIDSRNRYSLLLCDIDEDRKTDFTSGAVAGQFEPKDCFKKLYEPSSNEKLMVTLDVLLYPMHKELVLSTLAHEFAHLISFYQKELSQFSGKKTMERWLNEFVSLCLEDLISVGMEWEGPRGYTGIGMPGYPPYLQSGRLPQFIPNLTLSLTPVNYGVPSVYENYATGYAFAAYLLRNYSHPDLLKKILRNTDDGFDAILTGIKSCGFNVTREDLFADFGTALVLSEMKNLPASSRLRYNAGKDGFVYSTDFILGSIDLNAYQKGTQIGPFFSSLKPEIEAPVQNYSHVIYRMSSETGFSPVNGIVPNGCIVTLVQK